MPVLEDVYSTNIVNDWYNFEEEYDRQMIRATKNAKWFKNIKQPGLTDWLQYDMDRAKRIHDDMAYLLKRVEQGSYKLPEARLDDMLTVLSTASLVLEVDNEALEMAFGGGLAAAFILFPWAMLQGRAKKLENTLKLLKKRLEVAKRERNEAYAQTAINTSLTIVMFLLPGVGLLARGGILVGQILVDNALGPSTSEAATMGGRGNTTSSHVAGAIEDATSVSKKTKTIAKGGGHATVVIGFAFDVNEVMTGHGNVEAVATLMDKAVKDLAHLQNLIKLNKPKIDKFLFLLKQWERDLSLLKQSAVSTRDDLDSLMIQVGYHP